MGQGRPVSAKEGMADSGAVARGFLLIAIFYVHALYGVFQSLGSDPVRAMMAGAQIKMLAPDVSAFFFLNGMAAPYLHRKGWLAAIKPSLTLLVLAAMSHIVATAINMALDGHFYSFAWFTHRMLKPIALGTGYENFVAWFLVVLAFARLFSYIFLRSLPLFLAIAIILAAAIWAGQSMGIPDNIYEWRNWPTATLFFLIGMRIPRDIRIGHTIGWAALAGSAALAWINRPSLLTEGICLSCDLGFVAQPMIGQYGSLPVYVAQQLLFILFILWVAAWSRDKMPGRAAAYIGNDSLSVLLLHGWVLVLLYPAAGRSLPDRESLFLFVSILCSVLVVHALLYFLFQAQLRWFSALAFRIGNLLMTVAEAIMAAVVSIGQQVFARHKLEQAE